MQRKAAGAREPFIVKNLESPRCNINITALMIFIRAVKGGKEKQAYN